jgi:hypothetical protein
LELLKHFAGYAAAEVHKAWREVFGIEEDALGLALPGGADEVEDIAGALEEGLAGGAGEVALAGLFEAIERHEGSFRVKDKERDG